MAYIGSKPADKPVVASDLDPTIITGQTALATAPADTDEFLISDAGVLKRLDASLIGGGLILQVLGATDSTNRSTSSTSFVTASNSLSVDITPSSTSSKIFILVTANIGQDGGDNKPAFTIYRDSTNLGGSDGMCEFRHLTRGDLFLPASVSYLDSPSSTSALTYQLYIRCATGAAILNSSHPVGATLKSSITVMEIAG